MKIKALTVKALEKYKIFVSFNDGTEGTYDLCESSGNGVFKIWDEDDNFNKVFINKDNGAITWPGAIDIDTLNAWFTINSIEPESYFQSHNKYAEYL